MRALLDVNMLVALLDVSHLHHRTATQWLADHSREGWASCPLTQNGCVRVLSLASYRGRQPPAIAAGRLGQATMDESHEFWPDSLSILERDRLRWNQVLTSRQITDAYLLALAVANRGRLVTFDQGISVKAVLGAQPNNLVILGRDPAPP